MKTQTISVMFPLIIHESSWVSRCEASGERAKPKNSLPNQINISRFFSLPPHDSTPKERERRENLKIIFHFLHGAEWNKNK
jgi:hypothetical protein